MSALILMVEREFYDMLGGCVQSMWPSCPETRAMADEILKHIACIKLKHDAAPRYDTLRTRLSAMIWYPPRNFEAFGRPH